MKKNIGALVVLLLTLVCTYYATEYRPNQAHLKLQKPFQLFEQLLSEKRALNSSSLNLLRYRDYQLFPQSGHDDSERWWIKGPGLAKPFPANKEFIMGLLRQLKSLRMVRHFSKEEIEQLPLNYCFPRPAQLEMTTTEAGLRLTVGKIMPLKDQFYLKVQQLDSSGQVQRETIGSAEYPHQLARYHWSQKTQGKDSSASPPPLGSQSFQALLSLSAKAFKDLRPFPASLRAKDFEKIEIQNNWNRSFNVLPGGETDPAIYSGLKYNREHFQKWWSQIQNLKAEEGWHWKEGEKESLKSQAQMRVSFSHSTPQLEFFLGKSSRQDRPYLLYSNHDVYAYRLSPAQAKLFFVNRQDFWAKKILDFRKISARPIPFHFFDRSLNFQFRKGAAEILTVTSSDRVLKLRPKMKAFKQLFALLYGLGPFARALRVSPRPKEGERPSQLEISIEGLDLGIYHHQGELVVVNRTHGHRIHFLVGKESPLPLFYHDYFAGEALGSVGEK